ncbi:DUF1761 family protein [Spongiibacter sp. KMU-166]|uniref:DUF1761 family protein n=1 Tax=Spongiibacter thalassae TaxID=2721624 RepID=A0ABX1GHW4_9GAMM|nr:DUF1761 family protein [Spongiibacter thalassae]NKI18067.1 DUF1761 family protein [Spongiibacter thalassae]
MSIFGVNPIAAIIAFAASSLLGYLWYLPQIMGTAWRTEQGLPPEALKPSPQALMVQMLATLLISWLIGVNVMLLQKGLLPAGTMILLLAMFVVSTWATRLIQGKNNKVALIDSSYAGAMTILNYLIYSIIY